MSELHTLMPNHKILHRQRVEPVHAASERAAVIETNKYSYLLSNYIFIPLACEISGVWCVEGIDFLDELGHRTSTATGWKKETHYLFQRLSVAIQRANAACFCGCFPVVDMHLRGLTRRHLPPRITLTLNIHCYQKKRIPIFWFGDTVTMSDLSKFNANSKVRATSA